MRLQKIISVIILLFVVFQLNAQSIDYDLQWKQIESLREKGKFNEALKQTKSVFKMAQDENNSVQMVKAIIHQFNYSQQFEENAIVKAIQEIEALKKQAKRVERALLDIALSDLYLFYYRNNSWDINKRQNISGTRPADLAFWTKEHFKNEIENLLEKSLSEEKILKETSSEYWKEIFVEDSLGFEVFPTLYDFVAWKAIDFYQDYDFHNQAKEDLLVLNDPLLFGDYEQFLKIDLQQTDKSFSNIKALQLYQKLTEIHKGRKTMKPLIYVESKRLEFIELKGQIDQKQDLINKTLYKDYQLFKGEKGSEFIAQKLFENLVSLGDEKSLKEAVAICNEMIGLNIETKFFKSKIQDLLKEDLYVEIKGVLIPNQVSFANLSFKNTKTVWIKIIQLDKGFVENNNNLHSIPFEELLSQKLVSEFNLRVSDSKRLIKRNGLVAIPKLDFGRYAVIASSGEDFDEEKSCLTASVFWVSNIQLVSKGRFGEYMLINRETGQAIDDAKIEVYSQQWEYSSRSNIEKLEETLYSNKDGSFKVKIGKNASVYFRISKGVDEWKSPQDYIREYSDNVRTREIHHFFTDRSIYRPGQIVYFKAILTEKKANDVKVLPNQATEIKLYGVNGKILQTINLISNEFGSVSGSFVLPLSGLKGNYRISDNKGSITFKVEEYKRPKFEVKIDQPRTEYQLNDSIEINGQALFYAGNGVQNASVKYKISRSAYHPWRYYYWPGLQEELAISAGEVKTDKNGDYQFKFKAIAPQREEFKSWYNYEVIVEITDETGETQLQKQNIRIGNTSLMISSNLPGVMDIENPKDVKLMAETPNGETLKPQIIFKLEKLRVPEKLQYQIEYDYDTLLVSKEIIDEEYSDYNFTKETPHIEAVVFERIFDTQIDSIIPKSIFRSLDIGKYKMTLSSIDKKGKQITDTSEFQVFSSTKNKLAQPQEFFSFVNDKNLEVGDTLKISFGSSYKKAKYYYQLSRLGETIKSEWIPKSKELNHIQIPVEDEFRGGFSVQVFMMKNNTFYQLGGIMDVPYSNKKLLVNLTTFRSVLEPGSQEKWRLKVSNENGDENAAEVLAGMYDASLDAIEQQSWKLWPYNPLSHYIWNIVNTAPKHIMERYKPVNYVNFALPEALKLNWAFNRNRLMREAHVMYSKAAPGGNMMRADITAEEPALIAYDGVEQNETHVDRITEELPLKENENLAVVPRKNLQETAFFYPQLSTDEEGNVEIGFTSPEALTRWKLMVLTHTKDMKIGHLTQEVTTQKELMVMPNLPRFLRGGDEIYISTKVLNLLEEDQRVNARLEILDAVTNEKLDLFIVGQVKEQEVSLQAKGQKEVTWMIQVPEKVGAVIIRILAEGEKHSDGEEHILPVLSQLHFLTETYPFTLSNEDNVNSNDLGIRLKDRQTDDALTLEIVSNPLWYVVQAIPNYQAPQKSDALQWMNYFYIQSMASHIVKENPEIEQVFKQWQMLSPEELESELFRDQELKKVMIEETPWLMNAQDQSQRKNEISRLFDENMLNLQLELASKKLQEMQKPNGGFGWIDGMKTSPWISARIASSLGQLLESGMLDLDKDFRFKNIIKKLVNYLDEELEVVYQKAIKEDQKYYSSQSHLLSARFYFLDLYPVKEEKAYSYFLNKWKEKKHEKSLNEKMKLAGVLWRFGEQKEAIELAEAMQDIALTDDHGGVYWRDFQRYESVRSQAEMIELFDLMDRDSKIIEGMKTWLLKQKRANDWGNNKSTARACLAMLSGSSKLSDSPKVYLTLNGEEKVIDGNAGTGYFKITWQGKEIDKVLESLNIRKEGRGMIFGALYDQYFEKMSEIETHEGGVSINKQIFVSKTQANEQILLPLNEGAEISLGDKVLVRMTLDNRQSMSFVHLRDYIPAGFENKNPLSAYRWQGSVSYYQSPGDIATDYFISYLPKGKFVLEYELNATISGTLNSGPSEIQSLYAPEFGGHSSGEMIEVVKNFAEDN